MSLVIFNARAAKLVAVDVAILVDDFPYISFLGRQHHPESVAI